MLATLVVIGWTLLGIALLAAAFLAAMLRVGARVDGHHVAAWVGVGPLHARVALPERTLTVRVLGIRMARRVLRGSARTASRGGAPARPERPGARTAEWRPGALLSLRARLGAYRGVLQRVVRRVHVDVCEGDLRIATPDPALTGMAYGLAEGVWAAFPPRHRSRLTVAPDFVGSLPGGRASVALRVRVAVLALAAWRVYWFERGRARRRRRRSSTPGRSGHATNRTARGARGAGA
jgi:hypothetical protein